jgi:Tol biopolymer transport system component
MVKGVPLIHRRWKSAAVLMLIALGTLVVGGLYWRLTRAASISEIDSVALSDFADLQLQPTLLPLTSLAGDVVSPTFSPDGKRVAFGWNGETNGGWDLYLKTIGMDRPVRLTDHPAPWLAAAWSPDGRNIAISRVAGENDAGVYLIPVTGGPERQIASQHLGRWGGNEISWSPTGKQIAFTDHPPESPMGTELLFLLSLDTLEQSAVKTDCRTASTPSFSPHGDLLAWVCVDSWSSVSLLVSRISDGHTERLLQGIAGIHGIAWSEDGRRIVFSSPWLGDLWEVLLSRPGHAEKLPFGHDASDVAVSRVGHRLAYVQHVQNTNIWRLNLSASPPRAQKLIVSSRTQLAPNISLDGSKIAFQSDRSGGSEVWVCNAEGSDAVQLTSFGIQQTGMPRFSPDGKSIAFDSRVGGEANIYIVDPNGGSPRKLNIDVHGNNLPSWSHDGRWIYFVNGEDARVPTVWKVPSEGGHAIRISQTDATFPLESPDGQYVYFSHHRRLRRVRTDGSAEQEVEGMPELQFNGDTWAPTESGIYFMVDAKPHGELRFFDLRSQKVSRIFSLEKSLPGWSGGISISPDVKWLLYPQMDGSASDLMMIENWK